MLDRGYLARLMRADVDADIKRWVIGLVHGVMTPGERREERDRWFRAGAALVTGGPHTRAAKLHSLALSMRGELPAEPDTSTARGCVAAALLVCGRVPSLKTLVRITDRIA